MFSTYNLKPFGRHLKKLRENSRYSQKYVQDLCGIHPDTLRRIENGETIPKYETLEILSQIYKYDLLELLRSYRSDEKLSLYYSRLDQLISRYNIHTLRKLSHDFELFMSNENPNLIDPYIYFQFQTILKGIGQYNSVDIYERQKSLDTFIEALQLSIKDFELSIFKNFTFNIFEMRILLLIALALTIKNYFELSNNYLLFVLDELEQFNKLDNQSSLLIIKIYLQLSYNSYNKEKDNEALEYADKGIKYCVENNLMFALYSLYYRKGIAEYLLKDDNYMDSLHKSIQILEIQKNYELANIYKNVTFKNYGIILS